MSAGRLCAAVTITVSLLTTVGCDVQYAEQLDSRVLVYCTEGSPESFNPQVVTTSNSFDASAHTIYNRLVEFKPGTTEIQAGLAERWSLSEDGKVYRFQLRLGVAFQTTENFTPSRFLNADDVIFSLNRQRLEDHPYHRINSSNYSYFDSMGLGDLIEDVKRIDDRTVEIHLSRPESPFLATMAMEFASILSAEYASELQQTGRMTMLDTAPVGTGPFELERYRTDAYIRYIPHDQYWRGPSTLESLVFAITPDASMRFARLSAGECDVMSNPLPVHVQAARQLPQIEVNELSGLNVAYWAFNTERPPLNQLAVRQALALAIDRQAIIKAVYRDNAVTAKGPIPPSIWAFEPELEDFSYDPEKARALLTQAGYPQGFTLDIWAMPVQRTYNPNARKMAEMMQQDLLQIGVTTHIVSYEWGTFLRKLQRGEHDTVLIGWTGDNGDPDNFLSPLLSCTSAESGGNRARWCNQQFDALIYLARQNADVEQRRKLYQRAQSLFREQTPWLPLAHTTQYQVMNTRVKGLVMEPSGVHSFYGVTLEESASDD